MKQTLSPSQSATLIAKGISADKASGQGEKIYKPITLQNGSIKRVFDGYTPIFTLADICSLLPKHIGDFGNLMMDFNNLYGKWDVCYELSEYMQSETELIDALFSTLCWAIDNGHIDLTK